jgi:phosphoglycerate dehydrogenase-like enzyme
MSGKIKIGFTGGFVSKDWLSLLSEIPNVECETFSEVLPEVTPEQIRGFDIVITGVPKWTKNTFAEKHQLVSVHRLGVGYDTVDVPALTETGVMLCITPDAVRRPMAVAIITFLLALSTKLMAKDKLTREGRWAEKNQYHGIGLVGRTLGSIGVGNIGHEMFLLAKAFGMKHIAYDPYVKQKAVEDVDVRLVDMDTVLAESDFLNISCMLNDETRHLIGEKELKKMKKTAFLINTSRGGVIDEAALINALQQGWIQGAGLDVFEQEPTPPDNPLLKMDNVIVAPHALGHTDQILSVMREQVLRQVSQIINGEVPEGLVNREVLDKPEFQNKYKLLQNR